MPTSSKLSPLQVAEALGVHRNTTYDLISKGTLPARKIGKRLVIDSEDLSRFLASTVVYPAPTSAVRNLGIEDPAAGSWFLVWREHATKRYFWFSPESTSAVPGAFIDLDGAAVRFSISGSPTVMKIRFTDLVTTSTASEA